MYFSIPQYPDFDMAEFNGYCDYDEIGISARVAKSEVFPIYKAKGFPMHLFCAEDLPLFFAIWCARESYAKFTGDGVSGMDKTYTTTASPVPLYVLPFRAGYSLTLCTALPESISFQTHKEESDPC